MAKRTVWLAMAASAALAACGTEVERPAAIAAPPPAAVSPASRDQCGASELQAMVGRPRSEIPVPVHPDLQRVACTQCPVTEDFNPRRLNFRFDSDTGLIREISCG